jgi:hypothetical protein
MKMEEKTEKYTFEMVWQTLQDLGEKMKETDRQMKETDRQMKETDIRIKNITKEVGGIGESNGAMAQEAIFHILDKDKTFAGISFDEVIPKVPVLNGFKTEADIDALMLNGDSIALIEIKYKVDTKDVKKLVFDTLDKFKENFPKYSNHKILLGVGGMSFDDEAITEAKNNGVGIIKVVGDKVEYHTEGIRIY